MILPSLYTAKYSWSCFLKDYFSINLRLWSIHTLWQCSQRLTLILLIRIDRQDFLSYSSCRIVAQYLYSIIYLAILDLFCQNCYRWYIPCQHCVAVKDRQTCNHKVASFCFKILIFMRHRKETVIRFQSSRFYFELRLETNGKGKVAPLHFFVHDLWYWNIFKCVSKTCLVFANVSGSIGQELFLLETLTTQVIVFKLHDHCCGWVQLKVYRPSAEVFGYELVPHTIVLDYE